MSVTTTCTALMTLALTRGKLLGKFWETIQAHTGRPIRAAVDLITSVVAKAKAAGSVTGDLVKELLSAIDSVRLAVSIAAGVKPEEDQGAVIERLCATAEALIDLAAWVRSVAPDTDTEAVFVGVVSAAKHEALAACAAAADIVERAPGIPTPTKTKVTRIKNKAEAIEDTEAVRQEADDPRPGTRDTSFVTRCEPDEKARQILALVARLEWQSSRLTEDNAFTAAMFVRTCGLVCEHTGASKVAYTSVIRKKDDHCRDAKGGKFQNKSVSEIAEALLSDPDTALVVENYPATSTLGYWVVDAIDTLNLAINEEQWRKVASWANTEFMRQASLVSARHDAMMDPVAMAMAACMLSRLITIAKSRMLRLGVGDFKLFPSAAQLLFAIRELFTLQGPSGIWPKYFPLFHYPVLSAILW